MSSEQNSELSFTLYSTTTKRQALCSLFVQSAIDPLRSLMLGRLHSCVFVCLLVCVVQLSGVWPVPSGQIALVVYSPSANYTRTTLLYCILLVNKIGPASLTNEVPFGSIWIWWCIIISPKSGWEYTNNTLLYTDYAIVHATRGVAAIGALYHLIYEIALLARLFQSKVIKYLK